MSIEDNTGAIDTTDVEPALEQDSPEPQQQQAAAPAPQAPAQPKGPNPKLIASMLMGQGALPPDAIQHASKDIHPSVGDDDRNVLALHKVAQTEGPQAAWQLMQTHRMAFNAKQSLGYAALQGTPQRPANLHAAVDAANQASSHVLDGSNVKFKVLGGPRGRH